MSIYTENEIRESPLYTQMYNSRYRMTPRKRVATQNTTSSLNWKFPVSAEREYALWIDREFRENIVSPTNKYVLENYDVWLHEFKKDSEEVLHKDGLRDILAGIKNVVKKAFSSFGAVSKVGNDVDDLNTNQWDKFVKEETGVNLSIFNNASKEFVQEWIDTNSIYLASLPEEYSNKIFQLVSEGVQSGVSRTVIATQINNEGKKFRGVFGEDNTQRRSERIARDQVGKLNSALSRSRMKQAKLDIYKWSTAGDERVRGTPGGKYSKSRYSHYKMDRMFKQVDNASKISDNGIDWRNVRGREEPRHAGQAINCRCTMIPSFVKMKKMVDDDIKKSAA
jgi:uncharacterized protein with gpF-like domain